MPCENCYSGYQWTSFQDSSTRCFRTISTPWTAPLNTVPFVEVQNTTFSTQNARLIFNWNLSGQTLGYNTLTASTLWVNSGATLVDGPLNRSGVWTDLSCNGDALPINKWVGITTCIENSGVSKNYYVGISAKDAFKINLDGETLINTHLLYPSGDTSLYEIWHIYEIEIPHGPHTLEIFGLNSGGDAVLGIEIYENTFNEVLTANTLANLNVIYNLKSDDTEVWTFQNLDGDYIGDSGYTCCDGFVVSTCSGSCLQYIVCGPDLTPVPVVQPSPTTTPTPTPTPLYSSMFLSGCCGGDVYKSSTSTKYILGETIRVSPYNFCYRVVSEPKFPPTNNLDDSLGFSYVDGCSDKSCLPCPTTTGGTENTCKILTIEDMVVECITTNPSQYNINDGIISLDISGGTPPYTNVWITPFGEVVSAVTLNNIYGGVYTATTVDFWGDYKVITQCSIVGPKECEFEPEVVPYPCISPSPASTPSPTATPKATPTPTPSNQSTITYCYSIRTAPEYGYNGVLFQYVNTDGILINDDTRNYTNQTAQVCARFGTVIGVGTLIIGGYDFCADDFTCNPNLVTTTTTAAPVTTTTTSGPVTTTTTSGPVTTTTTAGPVTTTTTTSIVPNPIFNCDVDDYNFKVINNHPNGIINGIQPLGWYVGNPGSSFPLSPGQTYLGSHQQINQTFTISIPRIVSTGCLKIYLNGVLADSSEVNAGGLYYFNLPILNNTCLVIIFDDEICPI